MRARAGLERVDARRSDRSVQRRPPCRRAVWCVIAGLLLAGEARAQAPPPLSKLFPIDGRVDFTRLARVRESVLTFVDTTTGAPVKETRLRWGIANDDRDLYVALEWTDDTYDHTFDLDLGPTDFDGVRILLDGDGDGTLEAGEDARFVLAANAGSFYLDQHIGGADEADLINDGYAKMAYDPARGGYQAEFLLPLTPDVRGEDALLDPVARPGSIPRYNLLLVDHFQPFVPAGNAAALADFGSDSTSWPLLPLHSSPPRVRAGIPGGLEGLIVFVSRHEEPLGEIYTFDPATRQVRRVTFVPGLFKDNVSLSHDRTKVVFHGAPDPEDYASYEIYAAGIDPGSPLVRLTSNQVLDGHPAWSPDDQRIAYASFRDGGEASIIVMTAAGTEIADLTPPGLDDNDPEYLPDGRIVFKTLRFTGFPLTRVAVMNEDGGGVAQLSFTDGVTDHDPVGDHAGGSAVFERFLKGTDYATDPDAPFTPWDLVVAPLDGSGERTVLHDPWVNWLPVPDPSDRYLCHLKNVGNGTSAHLITMEGEDLGRLIPDITRITYIDWK